MNELTQGRARLTRDEAAQQLSVSPDELDSLLALGRLTCRVDGSTVYFEHADLVAYLTSLPAEAAK